MIISFNCLVSLLKIIIDTKIQLATYFRFTIDHWRCVYFRDYLYIVALLKVNVLSQSYPAKLAAENLRHSWETYSLKHIWPDLYWSHQNSRIMNRISIVVAILFHVECVQFRNVWTVIRHDIFSYFSNARNTFHETW
jgi:hypothetical protein